MIRMLLFTTVVLLLLFYSETKREETLAKNDGVSMILYDAQEDKPNYPYCKVKPKILKRINNLLRNTRKIKHSVVSNAISLLQKITQKYRQKWRKTRRRHKNRKRDKRQTITWPFNCAHASFTFNEGQLMMHVQAFECCEKCRFPAFSRCVASGNGNVCIGEGLRCINRCTDEHIRRCGALQATVGENWTSRGNSSKQRCPSEVKTTGQSYCIQRSCIPLDI